MTKIQPRKRPQQRRSRQTVDAILEATARLLVRDGYEKVNTNVVAEVAGVSIGTLYQYFPNKESLLMAVFEKHSQEMLGLLEETVESLIDAPVEVAIRYYIRSLVEMQGVDPGLHRVLLIQTLHLGLDYLLELQERAVMAVRFYLEGHKEKLLPQNLDLAAFVLVTTVECITHNALLLKRTPSFDTDALANEVEQVVLRYLLPPTSA